MSNPVGVIGLGLLGSALAERLIGGGFDVVVFNRTRDKAQRLLRLGARWSENPLADCQHVVICLYTTDVVQDVLGRLRDAMRPGHILIDTTTGDPRQTALLGQRLAADGIHYLESPIAASSQQTRSGEAVAIVAGPMEPYEACRDIFDAIAAKTFHVGQAWGLAARMKLVNNLVLGLNRLALAEGLALARAVGLSPADALEVLKQGNAYSIVMDVKGRKMVERDFSIQAKLSQHLKDVRLMLKEAQLSSIQLPVSELHRKLLEDLERAGYGQDDNSAVIRAYDPLPEDGAAGESQR
jgi:3-hydroxyisobutyrate dehydrogenase-like beta-hydroxyacid dehydrogenase